MKTLSPFFPDPDPNIETEVRAILMNHYAPIYKARVNSFLDTSLAIEPFAGRFDFLRSSISEDIFNQHAAILISGFGMGSEMIMARRFGFVKVFGVEVEQILVEATKMRLSKYTDMHPSFYEGKYLPFEDGLFNVVASGHVIEHTMDPRLYLKEIFRVLIPGGYLLLEFPHRYHMI